MFRLRCILHASKIQEEQAPCASVDPDCQRRDRQPGTDTSISAEFSTAYRLAQESPRHMSFLLPPFSSFEIRCRETLPALPISLYFLTRSFFSFIRPHFNQEQFRLFEQRREYYSADYARLFRLENPSCDFRRAGGSSPTGVFLLEIYTYITTNDVSKLFRPRCSRMPIFPFDGALQLFSTNYMIKIFLCRNSAEDLATRRVTFHGNAQDADQ